MNLKILEKAAKSKRREATTTTVMLATDDLVHLVIDLGGEILDIPYSPDAASAIATLLIQGSMQVKGTPRALVN